MKKITVISLLSASVLIASCGGGNTTLVKGTVDSAISSEVRVKVGDLVDTVVSAEGGAFALEIPVDVTKVGFVQFAGRSYGFISDGSEISVDFTSAEVCPVSSGSRECAAYLAYQDSVKNFVNGYRAGLSAIAEDATLSDEEKESRSEEYYSNVYDGFIAYNKEVISSNVQNALSLVALQNIYNEYEAGELSEILASLAPALREDSFIVSLKKSNDAVAATSEGMMFTDFEVEVEPGRIQKLSDYVGKGKYMLVDFWASWCGPCKGEIPNLKQVYERYHGENFDILSVAVWDQPQASIDTAAAYRIPWNHMVNAQKIPTDLYGIQGIPHIILFGPDGTIIKRNLRGEAIGRTVGEYVK